ncbi:MAG: hypothetical protein ACWGPN_16940 [Gammaproteobacteria bacterium]
MKAVFLDFGTMGAGLDLRGLESLVSELVIHDDSPDDTVAERIADAEIVFTNKIRLTRTLLELAPRLKFIALTATGGLRKRTRYRRRQHPPLLHAIRCRTCVRGAAIADPQPGPISAVGACG